ncbi:hypothetical protein KZ810_01365 [Sphingomonas sp. RHCKR47]|uniref:hypothetical protein n=1 Tax=Sphingomonas citricola TaxID=2862498 RepID=UPI001CA5F255|nr:hypothetical protein [Sphingomonas citricola]MBW6522136.1 hypothetical protein [Sphingomonas citricola]
MHGDPRTRPEPMLREVRKSLPRQPVAHLLEAHEVVGIGQSQVDEVAAMLPRANSRQHRR